MVTNPNAHRQSSEIKVHIVAASDFKTLTSISTNHHLLMCTDHDKTRMGIVYNQGWAGPQVNLKYENEQTCRGCQLEPSRVGKENRQDLNPDIVSLNKATFNCRVGSRGPGGLVQTVSRLLTEQQQQQRQTSSAATEQSAYVMNPSICLFHPKQRESALGGSSTKTDRKLTWSKWALNLWNFPN